jgi:hypothetical protein
MKKNRSGCDTKPRSVASSFLFGPVATRDIARVVHESASLIDGDPCTWEELGKGEQDEAMAHIEFRAANPDAPVDGWHTLQNPDGCKWDEVCMWRKLRAAMYLAAIRLRKIEWNQQSDQCSSHA